MRGKPELIVLDHGIESPRTLFLLRLRLPAAPAFHRARKTDAERPLQGLQRPDTGRVPERAAILQPRQARHKVANRVTDYNHSRSPSALGYETPAAYAASSPDARLNATEALHRRNSAILMRRLRLQLDESRGQGSCPGRRTAIKLIQN